jgi:hypothetical protein
MGGIVGKALGTVGSIAMGTNPLLAVGSTIAGSALQNAFAGGGGSSPSAGGGTTPQYALPEYNYGAKTYTYGGNPYDASKYFITGDKGVYNLLPMLGDAYNDPNKKDMTTGSYNTYQTIYDKMAGDAAAQAAFAKAYAPQSYTYTPPPVQYNAYGLPDHSMGNGNGSMNAFGLPSLGAHNNNIDNSAFHGLRLPGDVRNDLRFTVNNQANAARAYYNPTGPNAVRPTTPYTYSPIQYVNFGLDKTANQFADYAAQNKNPFFVPFAPKAATTATNTTTNPAAVTTNPTTNFQTPAKFSAGGLMGLLRN